MESLRYSCSGMFARCASRITGTALLSATASLTDRRRHGQTFARIPSSQGQEGVKILRTTLRM
jgi:hypothetical protein